MNYKLILYILILNLFNISLFAQSPAPPLNTPPTMPSPTIPNGAPAVPMPTNPTASPTMPLPPLSPVNNSSNNPVLLNNNANANSSDNSINSSPPPINLSPNNDIKNSNKTPDSKNENDKNDKDKLTKISSESISDSLSKIINTQPEVKIEILMFSDQELSNVNRALNSLKNNQVFVPDEGAEGLGDEESKEKEEAEKLAEKKKKEEEEMQENEKSYIYLASIIYFNKQDWVIWLNDQKISNNDNLPEKEIYIENVSPNKVKVRWKMNLSKWKILSGKKDQALAPLISPDSNIVQSDFILSPNQTYILGSNSVVEGKAVVALMKKKESKSDGKKAGTKGAKEEAKTEKPESSKGSSMNPFATIQKLQQLNKEVQQYQDDYSQ